MKLNPIVWCCMLMPFLIAACDENSITDDGKTEKVATYNFTVTGGILNGKSFKGDIIADPNDTSGDNYVFQHVEVRGSASEERVVFDVGWARLGFFGTLRADDAGASQFSMSRDNALFSQGSTISIRVEDDNTGDIVYFELLDGTGNASKYGKIHDAGKEAYFSIDFEGGVEEYVPQGSNRNETGNEVRIVGSFEVL